MKIIKLDEAGTTSALLGMGLSHGATESITKCPASLAYWLHPEKFTVPMKICHLDAQIFTRSLKLAHLGNGHNEFLKQIETWWLIEAPDYFFTQLDQYSFVTDLSTSTMHTILKRDLTQNDFEGHIPENYLELLNGFRLEVIGGRMKLDEFVGRLPRGYLYTRVVHMNYMCLQNIVNQRTGHKLPQWKIFIDAVRNQVEHSEWIFREE